MGFERICIFQKVIQHYGHIKNPVFILYYHFPVIFFHNLLYNTQAHAMLFPITLTGQISRAFFFPFPCISVFYLHVDLIEIRTQEQTLRLIQQINNSDKGSGNTLLSSSQATD